MKRKEMIQLIVAAVIIVAAGAFIYSQLTPKKGSAAQSIPTYQVITPIAKDFDSSSLSFLTDPTKTRDFYQAPNLSSGLGNPAPFGSQ